MDSSDADCLDLSHRNNKCLKRCLFFFLLITFLPLYIEPLLCVLPCSSLTSIIQPLFFSLLRNALLPFCASHPLPSLLVIMPVSYILLLPYPMTSPYVVSYSILTFPIILPLSSPSIPFLPFCASSLTPFSPFPPPAGRHVVRQRPQ